VANVRLAVSGGKKAELKDGVVEEDKTSWFAVDIWGEEAMRMVEHVHKGKTICVQGQLKTDTWTDKDTGAPRSRVKIVAKNFSLVQSAKMQGERGGGGGAGYQQSNSYGEQQFMEVGDQSAPPRQQQQQMGAGMAAGTSPKEALWRSLAEQPDTWWDNRDRKAAPGANPRSPDFKHKETGEALWIESRDTPTWVLETLGGAEPAAATPARQNNDSGAYRGASNPTAYEPDYSQPYGQQQYAGGYQPLDDGYAPARPFNPDDPPF
jgi:single-strand DNA-binding protein